MCRKFQKSFRYLWVNSVQVAREGVSFVNIQGTMQQKVGRPSRNYRVGLTYPENWV